MSERTRIIENLEACWRSFDELVAGLGPDDWKVQSLCPDWTVHGVVAHVTSVEHALSGWIPESADTPPPFNLAGKFAAEAAELSGDDLADRTREVLAVRRKDLAGMTDADFERPCMTPVGPATYAKFMKIREFDFWVHERDVRVPLDRPGDDGGPAAEMAVDEVEGSLGYIIGKKVGLPDAKSIVIHLSGPVERDLCAVVEGRARVVDSIDDPDVELTTDSLTFMLLACGRIDPQLPIDAGRISWSGDAELGEQAARNLRYTM